MPSADFVVGRTYAADSISSATEAFVHLDDGVAAYISRLASAPTHHAILSLEQIGYRGEMPDWVGEAFGRDEPFLVFLEKTPGGFEFVGPAMACTFRSARGKPFEIAFHVPDLSRELVAAMAPRLLEEREPQPWSATAYIEVTRSDDEWTARALGHDVSFSSLELLGALSSVETVLAEVLLQRARSGEELAVTAPDTSAMHALGPLLGGATDARYRRVVVRVGYFSADLAVAGWAMSRHESWAD